MGKWLAFDLEIVKIIPEGETDWKKHRPFGISCAATLRSDEDTPTLWTSVFYQGAMKQTAVCNLIDYLRYRQQDDYTIVTWNGAGFDFDVLAEESGMVEACKELALNHVDMFFHVFCLLGHAPGLDRAARGMGLAGKPEGMDGAQAPILWQLGQYQKVLDYLAGDVRMTLALAQMVEQSGSLEWISKNDNAMSVQIDRWLTVKEAMELPEPDTSWMINAWSRSKFVGWLV